MEVIALLVSVLSLAVAGIGTFQANKRATEALAESRRAAGDARWFAAQEAVQRLIGFDPTAEPLKDRLANLRIATIALVDSLDGWAGLDRWLEAERVLGATLGRQVMESARPGDGVEERLTQLDPLMSWAQALSQNLRLLRSTGHDEQVLGKLRVNAEALVKRIHERHGWQLPPTSNPRIQPLE